MKMLKEEEKYPSKTSLEAEAESIPPRPLSALANSSDDAVRSYFMPDTLSLVKGKSMPSLRYAVLHNRKIGSNVALFIVFRAVNNFCFYFFSSTLCMLLYALFYLSFYT